MMINAHSNTSQSKKIIYLNLNLLLLGGLGSLLQRVKELLEEGGALWLLGLNDGLLRCLEGQLSRVSPVE